MWIQLAETWNASRASIELHIAGLQADGELIPEERRFCFREPLAAFDSAAEGPPGYPR